MRRFVPGCSALVLAVASLAGAQNFTTGPCHDEQSHGSWMFGHQERACELRRTTLPLSNGRLSVNGKNGGIEVVGEDRPDIALEAKVTAQGPSREEAESTLREIRIVTAGDIHAEGPKEQDWGRRNWSVSFLLHVPRHLASTELRTMNGGITVTNVEGDLHADTMNGGLSLRGLAGTVHAQTPNGGVNVTLAGNRWEGSGMFVKTTNGGVSVKVPSSFAAHLVADTTNGGVSVAFPVPNVDTRHRNHVETDINGGGPPVRLETTNGGVSVARL